MSSEGLKKPKQSAAMKKFGEIGRRLELLRNTACSISSLETGSNTDLAFVQERVMYGRKLEEERNDAIVGGKLLELDVAMELRQVVFGSALTPPRAEWLKTGFVFPDQVQELSYGLRSLRNSTKGLLSVVQAYLIKYFLFEKKTVEPGASGFSLKLNKKDQKEGLLTALSNILWTVGDEKNCCVCLAREVSVPQICFNSYLPDGLTEYVHMFEFSAVEDVRAFLNRYIYVFLQETGPGALLLLYSAILTRGLAKIKHDMGDDKTCLVSTDTEGSRSIITLLLTGKATPYLHNGVVYVGDEDHYALPQWGIVARSEIGYLVYENFNFKSVEESKQPGSRLKTPKFPIWVTNCSGHHGIIFNTNSELLKNYHAERRFDLHYFSVEGKYLLMTIDTRYQEKQNDAGDSENNDEFFLKTSPSMEKLIHTKWEGAHVKFSDGINPTA